MGSIPTFGTNAWACSKVATRSPKPSAVSSILTLRAKKSEYRIMAYYRTLPKFGFQFDSEYSL